MSESLVPRESALPASREEMLTRQFYDWELRGRGWRVCSYPVELEPPFRGIYFYDSVPEVVTDDGRIPTFFSRLFGGDESGRKSQKPDFTESEYLARIEEMDEPPVCGYYEEEFHELQIILPKDRKIAKPFVDQLVTSASFCTNPISFEIVGTAGEIIVQMAATERDLPLLRQQLVAYFPDARFQEIQDSFLEYSWEDADGDSQIVDFGLSNEFMIPLQTVSNLELDPLVSIVGSLTELEYGELGVFQVLFQKARSNWASEIMEAVRFADGTPVFSNAPEMIPHTKQKLSSPLYAAVIRVASKANDKERVWQIVRGISAGMSQLSNPARNELIPLTNEGYNREYHERALLRRLSFRCGMILNLDELVSLVHPPSQVVRSAKLLRESELTKAAPSMAQGNRLVLGDNHHQNSVTAVTLSNDQRTRHLHLIGSSGSGKSTLLLSLITQDLEQDQGLCVIDPHGDLIDAVIENIPESRTKDVILFDPSDAEYPIGFNILQANSLLEKNLLSSDLVATFRRMSTSWGDVMDSVLANAILAFVESSRGGTLFELKRFLVEPDFRAEFLESVTDDSIVYFWENEFPLISGKPQASILIRLDAFLRQSLIRNIVCQKENKLDFRGIMDNRKVLLIKLSQGLIGEENAYLLGTMLVSRLYQSALSRQDSNDRPYFWLYLDEFHHFITPSMERILSGTRKYNLGLILAHQEFRQMQSRSQEVASSVLSNCCTRVCFRLGDNDAEKFAGGFSFFDSRALQNLGVGEAIARVERADYDFNLTVTQVPAVANEVARVRTNAVIEFSRAHFARQRAEVEAELSSNRPKTPKGKSREQPIGSEPPTGSSLPTAQARPNKTSSPETSEHRYLQNIVKRIGEDMGFVATIEKPVFGGIGKIDVALENEFHKIACEIAITNSTDYEVQNIQKCLTSGFDRVAVISTDGRHLQNIKKRVELVLSPVHFARVLFLEPENFHLFLESLQAKDSGEEAEPQRVKGYTIKVSEKDNSPSEAATKKNVIVDILSRVIRRKKRSDEK